MDPRESGSTQAGQDGAHQLPDPQTLFQQHLAHWQAAFQEYWKCMASQGAAMPQQWAAQAMVGGGYGAMPYFAGGMMNPYGGMMDSNMPMQPQGNLPAAGMPLSSEVTEPAVAPPVLAATTATTGTSSQAEMNGNGEDSDADSGLTTDEEPAEQLADILMPVLDTAAAAPISPHDAVPETGSFATALTSDAGVPSSAAAAATVSATATGLPASAPGTLPDVVAASSGMPANSVPAAHVAHVAPVLLPTSGLAATAATAPSRPAVASIGLPLMGLAQPTALAGVSQAAVQLSGMTEHAGSLSRHHSAALSLLGEDGQALDEKDLKRLRRKQSNRESARRSRLRKQAENDTLQQRLHDCEAQRNSLVAENAALKQRMEQLTVLVARLSHDKAALLTQVRGLGGQVPAELEAAPLTTISTIAADTIQQQLAAAAAVSQAVTATQTTVAIPVAAAVAAPPGVNMSAIAGIPDQLQPHTIQLQGIPMSSSQPNTSAAAATTGVATAVLASA